MFAWIGPFRLSTTSPFYYRILSPVILVEFDHQSGIVYDNDTPSRDHIHTVVRTPNGNDYGKDLLHQHYTPSMRHSAPWDRPAPQSSSHGRAASAPQPVVACGVVPDNQR